MVEEAVQFAEGDSMQGSHYCNNVGCYILQWRHCEAVPNPSFDFSLMSHKCKIVYYFELLDSMDFKLVLLEFYEVALLTFLMFVRSIEIHLFWKSHTICLMNGIDYADVIVF